MININFLTDTLTIFESSFWGGAEALLFLKIVIRNFLVQKVPELAKNRDFHVLAVRNTGFQKVDETPYIIHG